jgi:hypothetical protein
MPWNFRPQQVATVAATQKAVQPPVNCRSVEIINTTPGDLTVQSDATDAGTSFVIVAGFSKTIDTHTRGFDPNFVAFYLTAAAGGTVVLIWS